MKKETHQEHSKRVLGEDRMATPCASWHGTFGGRCLNCGYEPAERETGYTPGERKIQKVKINQRIELPADGSTHYSVFVKTGDRIWETCGEFIENEGDARLYVAAPDLLEACKEVMANIRAMTSFIPYSTIECLEAAILRAEGRD